MVSILKRLSTRRSTGQSGGRAPTSALARQVAEAGMPMDGWLDARGAENRLYPMPSKETLAGLDCRVPGKAAATVAAADRVLEHRFDLLGSGPFVPVDPDRGAGPGDYRPMDWYLDPVSGLRFPRGVHLEEWNLETMRPGMADVKLPWELARCQHWAPLAQAFRLTGDERYAAEIAHQLDDFMEANPVGIGVNWTCTMDVAIRAANWALALELVGDAACLDSSFPRRAHGALFDHGGFIFANLENTYEVTSNHFLSNLVGLYFLGESFRDLPAGAEWRSFCRDSLEEEIHKQVLDDGADFESAIPYHRLVAELFLGAARLADASGDPLSPSYLGRLAAMIDYLLGVLRPDGLMPQVGDADDGRLHVFTDYGAWAPQDGRHLLAPAALLLDRPQWLRHAGADGIWEAAWWGFDSDGVEVGDEPPPPIHRLFADAGHAVYRGEGLYLLVCNGVVGTAGFGNHKHNDQLAFEFHGRGGPLLVDPGSHVYTSDPDSRNLFRGTAYHNTLMVDGTEQNETNPEWLFRMFDSGAPETVSFDRGGAYVEYRGRHLGYGRLEPPVTHQRVLRLLVDDSVLLIGDVLSGEGSHSLDWHFHCAPGVEILGTDDDVVWLRGGGELFGLSSLEQIRVSTGTGWYSPSYGVKVGCPMVDFRTVARLDGNPVWVFAVAPAEWFAGDEAADVLSTFRRGLEADGIE